MTENLWRVLDVIDRYQLHASGAPVDLSPLREICELTYEDLSRYGIAGMCYATEPASVSAPAQIIVSTSLDDDERRYVYAHEAAHGIFGHNGTLRLESIDPWFLGQQEREAWQAAALMLVPPLDTIHTSDLTMDNLAALCGIPRWLLDLYP